MHSCQVCGKEHLYAFTCHYCREKFCTDHRLPESHECPNLPDEPVFWYQKRTHQLRRDLVKTKYDVVCPSCSSHFIGALGFDRKQVHYVCETCGYDWVAPRRTKADETDQDKEEDIARLRRRTEEETKPGKKRKRWRFF